jgi:hypothetical protein
VQALKIAGTNLIKGVPRLLGETAAIIVVTDIIPKLVIQNAGLDISANQKVGPYTNKNGAGIDLYAHETARLHGATKIPAAAKAELDATVRAEKMEAAKKQSLAWRWFNLDNPNSLLARMVGTIPITPSRAIAKLDGQFAAIFSPIKLATTYGQTTLAITSGSYVYADDGVNPYGNQNYMWTDSQLETSPAENATYVLNKIDSDKDFKGKYDKCFNDSITKVTLHPDDYKHCDDDDAVKYGLYMFDTQTVENLASLTNDEDDEGLGGGGGGSSSGGGGTIVTGTSKELATQILQKSDRITFTTGEAKQEMTQIAAGQEIKVPCGSGTTSLNPVLLGALLAASDKYVIGIGYLANGCHSANSRHYTGDAVDINTLNGKQSDGLTQLDWDFLNYIGPMLPNGSGFGQSACGVAAHVKLSNVTVFADPCTHIHIQVPRS